MPIVYVWYGALKARMKSWVNLLSSWNQGFDNRWFRISTRKTMIYLCLAIFTNHSGICSAILCGNFPFVPTISVPSQTQGNCHATWGVAFFRKLLLRSTRSIPPCLFDRSNQKHAAVKATSKKVAFELDLVAYQLPRCWLKRITSRIALVKKLNKYAWATILPQCSFTKVLLVEPSCKTKRIWLNGWVFSLVRPTLYGIFYVLVQLSY